MANAYRKLNSNAKVTDISITVYNALIDLLNTQQPTGNGKISGFDLDQSVFQCRNDTGEDLSEYAPVGVYGPLFSPSENLAEFKNKMPLRAVLPTPDYYIGNWGVFLNAVPEDGIGRLCVSGVVPVRVYVDKAGDEYCDVITAKTVDSETCSIGTGRTGARILWRENMDSGAGTIVWAIVRLGSSPPRECWAWATTHEAVASTDTTFHVAHVTPFNGEVWPLQEDVEIVVKNYPDAFTIDNGVRGKIVYCYDASDDAGYNWDGSQTYAPTGWGWHPFDFPCPAEL